MELNIWTWSKATIVTILVILRSVCYNFRSFSIAIILKCLHIFSISFSTSITENALSFHETEGSRKPKEHGQLANQFCRKLLEFGVFVLENVEQADTWGLEFRSEEVRGERNAVNQLANCCPLFDYVELFSRWYLRPGARQLSFSLSSWLLPRATSNPIYRNENYTRFPGTACLFPRGRPPCCRQSRSIERRQLLDSQG